MSTATLQVDVRGLLLDAPAFGPDEVQQLTSAVTAGQISEIRQYLRELEQRTRSGKPAQRDLLVLGITNYLIGKTMQAVEVLSQVNSNGLADFYHAEALLALGRAEEAAEKYAEAAKHGFDSVKSTLCRAGALRACGQTDDAEELVRSTGREGATRAEYSFQMGCLLADRGDQYGAIEYFERAVDMDPYHTKALFRLAGLNDLLGNDDEAIKLYERALSKPPFFLGALINLGLLYEDRENYPAAEFCFRRVLEFDPNHSRALLYMKDIEATGDMYYDEEELRRRSEIEQQMRISVSDFELSARARNCLERAGIETLGDLTKISEQELLAGKNFGETSLKEIAELLESRGLRIGQFTEEQPPVARPYQPETLSPQERVLLDSPVSDLNLSVRARKCLTKLGINTLGALVSRTPDELLSIRNFGVTSLNEIREKLSERDLKLRSD